MAGRGRWQVVGEGLASPTAEWLTGDERVESSVGASFFTAIIGGRVISLS